MFYFSNCLNAVDLDWSRQRHRAGRSESGSPLKNNYELGWTLVKYWRSQRNALQSPLKKIPKRSYLFIALTWNFNVFFLCQNGLYTLEVVINFSWIPPLNTEKNNFDR